MINLLLRNQQSSVILIPMNDLIKTVWTSELTICLGFSCLSGRELVFSNTTEPNPKEYSYNNNMLLLQQSWTWSCAVRPERKENSSCAGCGRPRQAETLSIRYVLKLEEMILAIMFLLLLKDILILLLLPKELWKESHSLKWLQHEECCLTVFELHKGFYPEYFSNWGFEKRNSGS